MSSNGLTRRSVVGGGAAVAGAAMVPGAALAQDEAARVLSAAGTKGAKLRGMIWAPYYKPMMASLEEFTKKSGISVDSIQDISTFDIPQRSMAEALSRSPEFDFFHVDAGMIPSLASAGLLEPLDSYMKKADFKIDAVGDFNQLVTYNGQTYGMPTDGNVHVHFQRTDLMTDDAKKKFADKMGKEMPTLPSTWDEEFELMKFFHNPDQELWGSGNLRNRANGVTWWLMYFYAHGGFPFDDDGNPTLNNHAGEAALKIHLREKEVAHPESPGWGTPQMIPRIAGGKVVACQYWDGIIKLNENPEKSKTTGMWAYGAPPAGTTADGKKLVRTISSPMVSLVVNRYSPRKEAAAYLSMWMATAKASDIAVSDNVNTFHDAWHKSHMTSPTVTKAYSKAGIEGVAKALQVAAPAIYVTGYLEFQDLLAKNLAEAYLGQLKAGDVLKKTEEEWGRVVKRIGKSKLKKDIASYKAVMPKITEPT